MTDRILLICCLDQQGLAEDLAIDYAASNGCALDVLLILNSHLFHYGRNDVVAPGYTRSQFLFHIRVDLLRQAGVRESLLRSKAAELELDFRIECVDEDDFEEVITRKAARGYRFIFIHREKKRRLPLFGKPRIETILQRKGFADIVSC